MLTVDFVARYDAIIRHPRMRALYGDSGYFNVGLWVDDINDQPRACDRLVDELAELVPAEARLIVDVGCGLGAGTRRLARRFPETKVVGGNLSSWQLAEARRGGLAHTIVMDAVSMPFPDGVADCVVAMESAQHFDTRERFLREAFRILRPGGRIVLADMLFRDREPIGSWMLPAANHVESPDAYADLLRAAGFAEVSVDDVTSVTWKPHCDAMGAASPEHRAQVGAFERSLAHYVFASARKR